MTKQGYLDLITEKLKPYRPYVFTGRAAAYLINRPEEEIDFVKWGIISDLDVYLLKPSKVNNTSVNIYGVNKPVQFIYKIPALKHLRAAAEWPEASKYCDIALTIEAYDTLNNNPNWNEVEKLAYNIVYTFDFRLIQSFIAQGDTQYFYQDAYESKLQYTARQKNWFKLFLDNVETRNDASIQKLSMHLNIVALRFYKYLTRNALDITNIDQDTLRLTSLFLQKAVQKQLINLRKQSIDSTDLVALALSEACSGRESYTHDWIPSEVYDYITDYSDIYRLV